MVGSTPAPPCCGRPRPAIDRASCFARCRPPSGDKLTALWSLFGLLAASATGLPAPARAQLSGSINLETDYRLRGYSLSKGRPTGTAHLAYDHPSGIYLGAAAIGVAGRDEESLLGVQGNVGYARRLSPTVSVDAGIHRSEYKTGYYGEWARYTEGYVGLTVRQVTARIFYSPHYFQEGVATVYGEVDAAMQPAPNWRLIAHIGALSYVRLPPYYYGNRDTQLDWRFAASRQIGRFEVHAALSGGGPGKEYYAGKERDRTVLTAGASVNF